MVDGQRNKTMIYTKFLNKMTPLVPQIIENTHPSKTFLYKNYIRLKDNLKA